MLFRSPAALIGAMADSEIPMSEHIRKEILYNCFTKFSAAIQAEPSLIVDEIRKHCARFDMLYGTRYQLSKEERTMPMRISQGDYRRFCTVFYLLTRRLLHFCEMIVLRENKKRIQPRHLMSAACMSGIVPFDLIKN